MTPILSYYPLSERVTAFSTTRHGGCSQGSYAELNINEYCGDAPESVQKNRRALCNVLHLDSDDASRLIVPHQVHGTEICQIGTEYLSLPTHLQQTILEGVDAVMTDVTNLCIGVSTADCIPIIIYDPAHHCAATVHAGWRGTVARIAIKTIQAMVSAYNSDPRQLKAIIGPGISRKNFEVGQEVYDAFQQAMFPMDKIAVMQEKWHIDLPLCNRLQLESTGIPSENIHDCGICTYDHADDYFSARRLSINSGRIYTGIVLRH